MSSSSRYERHYEVGLLDDLHNYFPAVLYEPERFANVQELLSYVREQARRRFDLFSAGERLYGGSQRAPAVAAAPAPAARPSPVAAQPSAPAIPARHYISRTFPQEEEVTVTMESLGHDLGLAAGLMNLMMPAPPQPRYGGGLNSLLGQVLMAGAGGGRTGSMAAGFGDAVPVRPTAAQIAAGTTVETVHTDDEVCAICQDDIPEGTQARKLNHCEHRFHVACIDTWFQRDPHCPVCRHDVRDTGGE